MVGMMLISLPFLPLSSILYYGFMSFIIFGALLLVGHLIVSEEEARRLLGETNLKLTEYAAQAEELATTKERNRMAREIHDNLGHYLTAINMQLEAAQAVLPTDPTRAQQAMSKAQGLTKEGLTEIRRSVAALRAAPVENLLLDEAITLLVEEYRANGLSINYHVEGSVRPASASVEMALYRIAQEGLTNIRKHAQATRAELELRYEDDGHVRLKMLNDGVKHASSKSGFGLIGIQERVKLLGGTLNIQQAEGQDFSLLVELPV
jgi:signal transduction histidine kinase